MELIIMKLFIIILDYNFFSKLQISHCHILWLPTILPNFVCKTCLKEIFKIRPVPFSSVLMKLLTALF